MPYDNSENEKLNDYLTGQAFGVGYNSDSAQGAKFYIKPGSENVPLPNQTNSINNTSSESSIVLQSKPSQRILQAETPLWGWIQDYEHFLHDVYRTWAFWVISLSLGIVAGLFGYISADEGTLSASSTISKDVFFLVVYGIAGCLVPLATGWLSMFVLGILQGVVEVLIYALKALLGILVFSGIAWILWTIFAG